MKKFLALFLVCLLCLSLCSCDLSFLKKGQGEEESGNPPAETGDSVTVEEDTTIELGKAVKAGELDVKFVAVRFAAEVLPKKNDGFYVTYKAAEGKTYLVVEAEIKNNAASAIKCDKAGTVSAKLDKETYPAFIIVDDETSGFTYANITEIPSGGTKNVRWLVEVPAGDEEAEWVLSLMAGEKTYEYTHNKAAE